MAATGKPMGRVDDAGTGLGTNVSSDTKKPDNARNLACAAAALAPAAGQDGGPAPLRPDALVKDGWFAERQVMWPGQAMCLQVDKVLEHVQSDFQVRLMCCGTPARHSCSEVCPPPFPIPHRRHRRTATCRFVQDILVFDSATYGRVLVLDGVIQITERDEFTYQEMLAHLPMMSLRREPKRVLVVGGGDGGIVRELMKYNSVESVVMCEIDPVVIQVARRWLARSTAVSLDDPRLTIVNQDAAIYMEGHAAEFDVIIVDSSDPVGPAESLFTAGFYANMAAALAPGGVVATQGECQFHHTDLIASTLKAASRLFTNADYAWTPVPTYPSGQIGFIMCSSDPTTGMLRQANRPVPAEVASNLRHYSPELHKAAYVLPAFAERAIGASRTAFAAKTDGPAESAGAQEANEPATVKVTSVAAGVCAIAVVGVLAWLRSRR